MLGKMQDKLEKWWDYCAGLKVLKSNFQIIENVVFGSFGMLSETNEMLKYIKMLYTKVTVAEPWQTKWRGRVGQSFAPVQILVEHNESLLRTI